MTQDFTEVAYWTFMDTLSSLFCSSGSMSIRWALHQTTMSIIKAKNIILAVIPKTFQIGMILLIVDFDYFIKIIEN